MQAIKYPPRHAPANGKGECGYLSGHALFPRNTDIRSIHRRSRRCSSSLPIVFCAVVSAFFAQTALGGEMQSSPDQAAGTVVQPGDSLSDLLSSGGAGPEMVVIPHGNFRMGCVSGRDCQDREMPVHEVSISRPFALAKHEITLAEFERFVRSTGYEASGSCLSQERGPYDYLAASGWRDPGYRQTDRHPVTCVSWNDAMAYTRWLSVETGQDYRLPTEAEWEYAARAGSSSQFSWGNMIGRQRANCVDCRTRWDGDRTAPAGSFTANGFGLHDMHGNVWEWVLDCSSDNYEGARGDESARVGDQCTARVLRGGSWSNGSERIRAAARSWLRADNRSFNLGFRVARDVSPSTLMGGLNQE